MELDPQRNDRSHQSGGHKPKDAHGHPTYRFLPVASSTARWTHGAGPSCSTSKCSKGGHCQWQANDKGYLW
jgi:hypothetical protein